MIESPFEKISADLRHYALREKCQPTLAFKARMVLLTPGFQFVLARRIQEIVETIPVVGRLIRRVWWWLTCLVFGSELAIGCKIGGGLYIPHPFGIVVGTCIIGRNCTLLQNITIGHKDRTGKGEPHLGDEVMLTAGCVVLGDVLIGEGALIGANAVVTKDVPAGYVAVGVPARVFPRKPTADAAPADNDEPGAEA